MKYPAVLLVFLVGCQQAMPQTFVSKAKDSVRAERMTEKEVADRDKLLADVQKAENALKVYENVMAAKHGANLRDGGFLISGSCWDAYEIKGELIIISKVCVPNL